MKRIIRRVGVSLLLVGVFVTAVQVPNAAPVRSGDTITDRKGFIPVRKQVPLGGKAVGVLVADAAPVILLEGRNGPAAQLCFSTGGTSYRWVYVPAERNATVGRLMVPVGPKGEPKLFENLNLASLASVKRWDITSPFALVEVEVNGGAGSPACDAFVATNMRRLDGTKEFPLKVDDVIADARKRYADFLSEKAAAMDESMNEALKSPTGNRKLTGPREKAELMYVTWLPDKEMLQIRFRSTVIDGEYKYANDIRIDLPRTMPVQTTRAATMSTPQAPNGFRQGKQFRTELGVAYDVAKTGKIVSTSILPIETTSQDVSPPAGFGGTGRTMSSSSSGSTSRKAP
ncbi:MAG: hypothetical protein ACJ8F7_10030 [Gemmataceae bacterium]